MKLTIENLSTGEVQVVEARAVSKEGWAGGPYRSYPKPQPPPVERTYFSQFEFSPPVAHIPDMIRLLRNMGETSTVGAVLYQKARRRANRSWPPFENLNETYRTIWDIEAMNPDQRKP